MVPDLTRRSLGSAFDPRANSLNALRLALALLVLVAHGAELGGYGRSLQPLGTWAVAGFFCVSGYLITASREHAGSLAAFLWRRFLRIYPAFVTVLIVVAFAIAPAAALFPGAGPWEPNDAATYVLRNLGLWILQPDIGTMLDTVPFPRVWNGSLWTLAYEALCYLTIGAVFLLPRRTRVVAMVGLFLSSSTVAALANLGAIFVPGAAASFAALLSYFLAGALLFFGRDRLPLRRDLELTSAALVVALASAGAFPGLASVPAAYVLMSLGIRLPLSRIGSRNDISYGLYIYAFPVQQVLACVFTGSALPLWAFLAMSLGATLPLAWASWLIIERPALRAKRLFARRWRGDQRAPNAAPQRPPGETSDAGLP